MDTTRLLLFVASSFVLVVTPGPAMLYVIARSASQGRLAGLASVLGVAIGDSMHVIAAAGGVSAILASSTLAFATVKYLGAAYLIYLGLRKFLGSSELGASPARTAAEPFGVILRRGVVVAALNPKTAMFFLAFPLQFVEPGRGAVELQLLLLGSITVALGLLSDSTYALLSSAAGGWLKRNPGVVRTERYLLGAIYCSLGVMAALSSIGPHQAAAV